MGGGRCGSIVRALSGEPHPDPLLGKEREPEASSTPGRAGTPIPREELEWAVRVDGAGALSGEPEMISTPEIGRAHV